MAATLVNISRGWRGRRFEAKDFLPDLDLQSRQKPAVVTDSRKIYGIFRDIAGRLKGKGQKR